MATESGSALPHSPATQVRIRRVLDNLFAFVGLLDLNGTVVDVNRASLQLVGVTRTEVLGRPIWECYWWSYDAEVQEHLRQAVKDAAGGKTVRYDVSVRMADHHRVIDFQLAPLRDEQGRVTHLIPSGVDITDRKLVERMLLQRTEHLAFLSASASGLLSADEPLSYLDHLFKELERLLGLDCFLYSAVAPGSARPMPVAYDGLSEEQFRTLKRSESLLQLCGTVAGAIEPVIVEDVQSRTDTQTDFIRSIGLSRYLCYPLLVHDTLVATLSLGARRGTRFDESSITLIRTTCDQVVTAIDRDRAARMLRQSEERARVLARKAECNHHRLQAAIEAVAQGLIVFSAQGDVIEVNPAFVRMHGFASIASARVPLEKFHRLFELRSPNGTTVAPAELPVSRGLRGETVSNYELELRRQGSSELLFIGSYNVAPVRDACGGILEVVVTIHDITLHRQMEETLRMVDRRKDIFLATLAHELRNPLAPIQSAAVILRSPGANEQQREWARTVVDRQVGHMARLLDDLLDVSRITRGCIELRLERVCVKAVMEAALETAQPLIDRKEQLVSLGYPEASVTIQADAARLTQICTNLLVNAAKYTDPKGRIFFGAADEGADVLIRVKDNGIGIGAELLPHVFEMFRRAPESTDRAKEGLGIGLSITKGLVEQHGGSIEARSNGPGTGAEFIVRLPKGR